MKPHGDPAANQATGVHIDRVRTIAGVAEDVSHGSVHIDGIRARAGGDSARHEAIGIERHRVGASACVNVGESNGGSQRSGIERKRIIAAAAGEVFHAVER